MTTDDHNIAVQDRHEMATKGGYVPACTTTEIEVQSQSYNRVIVGSYPVELVFG